MTHADSSVASDSIKHLISNKKGGHFHGRLFCQLIGMLWRPEFKTGNDFAAGFRNKNRGSGLFRVQYQY